MTREILTFLCMYENFNKLLVVRDNGIGLGEQDSRSGRGGIASMRARAQSHKGLCEFAGAPNAGTVVTLSLPISEAS